MRAAIIDAPGAVARCGDFPDPEPAEGEAVLEVLAVGIHPIVRSLAAGTHYGSDGVFPRVPGVDCVARGADEVARYAGFIRPPWGTLAQKVAARPGIVVPQGADPALVAGSLNPGLSSWLPLADRTQQVERLGTVLVVGATGVAGRLAVQNALLLGADRVVGLGRNLDRLADVATLGAVPVALTDGPGALRRALAGTSPSLVLDYVWGPAAELVWDVLAGHDLAEDHADILHVQIGATGAPRAALPAALLRSRRLTVRGSGAGSASIAHVMAELPVYLRHVASGRITAAVRTFPLSRIDEAWQYAGPDRAVVVPD